MMHNLVADSADTSTVVCCCSYNYICRVLSEGFPQYVAPEQNGGETEVYTLQRIGPILNVGCYLEAVYPTSGTLVTLV